MDELDRPVLVVDLRKEALAADRAAIEGEPAPASPPDEPLADEETIDTVAVLHDESEPLLLPIEPTRDRRYLDALARLFRFAVLRGERIPETAVRYGTEYERTLAFARRLPAWAYDGIERPPSALRRTLKKGQRP
jgi:hypothetical protein